jgi:hypothetical protein
VIFTVEVLLGSFSQPSNVLTSAQALETTGLQKNDPRLSETLANLERVAAEETEKEGEPVSIENLHLDRETFRRYSGSLHPDPLKGSSID